MNQVTQVIKVNLPFCGVSASNRNDDPAGIRWINIVI